MWKFKFIQCSVIEVNRNSMWVNIKYYFSFLSYYKYHWLFKVTIVAMYFGVIAYVEVNFMTIALGTSVWKWAYAVKLFYTVKWYSIIL